MDLPGYSSFTVSTAPQMTLDQALSEFKIAAGVLAICKAFPSWPLDFQAYALNRAKSALVDESVFEPTLDFDFDGGRKATEVVDNFISWLWDMDANQRNELIDRLNEAHNEMVSNHTFAEVEQEELHVIPTWVMSNEQWFNRIRQWARLDEAAFARYAGKVMLSFSEKEKTVMNQWMLSKVVAQDTVAGAENLINVLRIAFENTPTRFEEVKREFTELNIEGIRGEMVLFPEEESQEILADPDVEWVKMVMLKASQGTHAFAPFLNSTIVPMLHKHMHSEFGKMIANKEWGSGQVDSLTTIGKFMIYLSRNHRADFQQVQAEYAKYRFR